MVQREQPIWTSSPQIPAVISAADAALEQAAVKSGWDVDRIRSHPMFARLVVSMPDGEVVMELAHDFRLQPTADFDIGPVLSVGVNAPGSMLLGGRPRGPGGSVNLQGDGQVDHARHGVHQDLTQFVVLVLDGLTDQLVVDLQQQL